MLENAKWHTDWERSSGDVALKHYSPRYRTWLNESVFSDQQLLLENLPNNASRLPDELLMLNTGNTIITHDDFNNITAILTKATAADALQCFPEYDAQINSAGNVCPGRLEEQLGIKKSDPIISILRAGSKAFYNAFTGDRILSSYESKDRVSDDLVQVGEQERMAA